MVRQACTAPLLLALLAAPAAASAADCFEEISPSELLLALQSDEPPPVLIDVRTTVEYHSPIGHIEGAISIPIHTLMRRLDELEGVRDQAVVLICFSGHRSVIAGDLLCDHGFAQLINLDGGMLRWHRLGYPVERE